MGAWHALETMTKSDGIKLAVADDMTGVPIPSSALSKLARSEGGVRTPHADRHRLHAPFRPRVTGRYEHQLEWHAVGARRR